MNCKLNGLLSDGKLEVSLGDYVSKPIDLKVINRPAISEINMVVEPPSYTGLKNYYSEIWQCPNACGIESETRNRTQQRP